MGQRAARFASVCVSALAAVCACAQPGTTINDFFFAGTQPNTLTQTMRSAQFECSFCHGYYDNKKEPYQPWAASMMGQAARDPIFFACLAIANQDAPGSGEMCIRCHAPMGWLRGNSADPTGALLNDSDLEGVSCSVCHRAVDPVYTPGVDPALDQGILAALSAPVPVQNGQALVGNTSLVIDPMDRRRGPFALDFYPHPWLQSPYHRSATLCGNCHDVSNPVYTRQSDGSYDLNALNEPHPTGNKHHMFPVERTFSEWANSAFGAGPINMGGRYGGNRGPSVSTCQDCHMPTALSTGCNPAFETVQRPDFPQHFFNGANTWVIRSVRALYDDSLTDLNDDLMNDSIQRAHDMVAAASDTELSYDSGSTLNVRVINQTGHKLPTGYPEGRRAWVNVQFLSANGDIIREFGAYNTETATLTKDDTKVYEAHLGLDQEAAGIFALPPGESFHFALNNTIVQDNRIPPRGFTNAGFAASLCAPVGYAYADGQYWDDTQYALPPAAQSVRVRVYHQTTTREYIEFLRDANVTNNAGQVAYEQWVLHGKSAPAVMDDVQLALPQNCSIDFNGDGLFPDVADIDDFLLNYSATSPACDINASGEVNSADIQAFIDRFAGAC